jgi:hypothetical protein
MSIQSQTTAAAAKAAIRRPDGFTTTYPPAATDKISADQRRRRTSETLHVVSIGLLRLSIANLDQHRRTTSPPRGRGPGRPTYPVDHQADTSFCALGRQPPGAATDSVTLTVGSSGATVTVVSVAGAVSVTVTVTVSVGPGTRLVEPSAVTVAVAT